MQAASDIFLGWTRATAPTAPSATSTSASSATGSSPCRSSRCARTGMALYARICGWTLARAHARSGDRVAIAAYLGGSDRFDRAIVRVRRGLRRPERAGLRGLLRTRQGPTGRRAPLGSVHWIRAALRLVQTTTLIQRTDPGQRRQSTQDDQGGDRQRVELERRSPGSRPAPGPGSTSAAAWPRPPWASSVTVPSTNSAGRARARAASGRDTSSAGNRSVSVTQRNAARRRQRGDHATSRTVRSMRAGHRHLQVEPHRQHGRENTKATKNAVCPTSHADAVAAVAVEPVDEPHDPVEQHEQRGREGGEPGRGSHVRRLPGPPP